MQYAVEVAKIRAARDRAIEQAQANARAKLAELAEQRDAEIRRLAAKGLSNPAIAAAVGCSRTQAYEVLNPEKREAYNRRRRERWHVYKGGKAA
jgi:DNA invertase Pin-like site-specific DNA recombinase